MRIIDRPSGFSSEAARERFEAAYDATVERLWPVPIDPLDVPTSLGTVRVYRAGPVGDDPVVLLSGAGGNALGWYRSAASGGRAPGRQRHDPGDRPDPARRRRPLLPAPAAVAPSWRIEVVPGTGHALPIELPDLVTERVLGFHPARPADDPATGRW